MKIAAGKPVGLFVLLAALLLFAGCDELQMVMSYRTPIFVSGNPEFTCLPVEGRQKKITPEVMTNREWHKLRLYDECPRRFAVRTGYEERVQLLLEGHGVLDIYPDTLLEVSGHMIGQVHLVQGRCDFMPITAALRRSYNALTNRRQRLAFLKKIKEKFVRDKDEMLFVANPFWVKTVFSSTVARKGRTFAITVDSNHLLDFRSFRVSRLEPRFTLIKRKKSFQDHFRYLAVTGLDIYEKGEGLHFSAAAKDLTGNWMKMRRYIPTEAFKFSYMKGKRLKQQRAGTRKGWCRFKKRYRKRLTRRFKADPKAKRRYYRLRSSRNRRLSFYWKYKQVFRNWKTIRKARANYARMVRKVTPKKYWHGKFMLPTGGVVTSAFGRYRYYFGGNSSLHKGVDIAALTGTSLLAANHGKVVFAGFTPAKGNNVVLDHGLGVYTAYFHLADIYVQAGDKVKKGDLVGTVGNTGLSSGAHLHWEMLVNGRHVNPLEWVHKGYW